MGACGGGWGLVRVKSKGGMVVMEVGGSGDKELEVSG